MAVNWTLPSVFTDCTDDDSCLDFSGFHFDEAISSKIFDIKKNKKSYTINIPDTNIFAQFQELMKYRYGQPRHHGRNGLIFLCPTPNGQVATVTTYETTERVHVQGMRADFEEWIEDIYFQFLLPKDGCSTPHHAYPMFVSQDYGPPAVSINDNGPGSTCVGPMVNNHGTVNQQPEVAVVTNDMVTCAGTCVETQTTITTTCMGIQASPHYQSTQTQTTASGDTETLLKQQHLDSETKLRQEIARLNNANKDLMKQVTEYRELRSSYVQLCSSLNEMSDRNAILQAKFDSIQQKDHHFVPPAKPAPTSTYAEVTKHIPIANRFDTLEIETCYPTTTASTPKQPTTKPTSFTCTLSTGNSPYRNRNITHQPTPAKTAQPLHKPTHQVQVKASQQVNRHLHLANVQHLQHQSTSPRLNTSIRHNSRKPVALIMGDSIPKHLIGRKLSWRYKVINYCLPGSTAEMWIKFAPSVLEEINPDVIIVHCGTNSITSECPEYCMNMLQKLGELINIHIPNAAIAFSGITGQLDMKRHAFSTLINNGIAHLCQLKRWTYINNENISLDHIARDGIHLNQKGLISLAGNYINFLRFNHEQSYPFQRDIAAWQKN